MLTKPAIWVFAFLFVLPAASSVSHPAVAMEHLDDEESLWRAVVVARHVMIYEKEIYVDWQKLETRLSADQRLHAIHPVFFITRGHDEVESFEDISKRVHQLEEKNVVRSAGVTRLLKQADWRYDQIQPTDKIHIPYERQLTGKVVDFQSHPLRYASVILVQHHQDPELKGQPYRIISAGSRPEFYENHVVAQTDENGKFSLPLSDDRPFVLVAFHKLAKDEGFTVIEGSKFQDGQTLLLLPYGKVTATGGPQFPRASISFKTEIKSETDVPLIILEQPYRNCEISRTDNSLTCHTIPPYFPTSIDRVKRNQQDETIETLETFTVEPGQSVTYTFPEQ